MIKKYHPTASEKGIQGTYVVKNNYSTKSPKGFFIDTEFQYKDRQMNMAGRMDMVWVDLNTEKIAFVELKTISDTRLNIVENQEKKNNNSQTIDLQLKRYYDYVSNHSDELRKYYELVFQIKNDLGLLPEFAIEKTLSSLLTF